MAKKKTMKTAIFGGVEEISIRKAAIPKVKPGCVLVAVKACGVCGSDLHFYYDEWQHGDVAAGHEFAGVVAEVGDGVERIKRGDRVCVECFSHCGECIYCQTGLYNLCVRRKFDAEGHGGFAEFSLVRERAVFPIPDAMSFEEAALVEPLAVGHHGFHLAGAGARDTVVILGAGMIGLCVLEAALAEGVKRALITAKYDHQALLAKEMGAEDVIHAPGGDIRGIVKDRTKGLGADAVIDTVAHAETVAAALDVVRRKGRIVLVGGFTKPIEADLEKIIMGEVIVTGSCCYGYSGMQKDFGACIERVAQRRFDYGKLITHRFPLDEIVEAFRLAADKTRGTIKVMVHM